MKIFPSRLVCRRLVLLALVACALVTLFSFLGRLHWALDLFSHFHLQYGLALLLVAICFGILKERTLLAASIVLLGIHVACLGYYFPGRASVKAADSPPLKVISFNVLTRNTRHEEVLRYLQEADADLILLLEVSTTWLEALRPLERSHPHVRKRPRSDNFGMALYSRHPIRAHKLQPLPRDLSCLITQVDWDGAPLTVIGAHPIPPVSATWARRRNEYLHHLGALAKEARADSSVLLLGDLNTTPWSHSFHDLVSNSGLEDSGKYRGFLSSWNRFNPLFSLPIDHILHSTDLQVVDRWVGPPIGSDHHPVGGSFQR